MRTSTIGPAANSLGPTIPQTTAVPAAVVTEVAGRVRDLCRRAGRLLPFHGWHHVSFVRAKGAEFARLNGADVGLVETAALVHDLNYLVVRNSAASAGRDLRMRILAESGVPSATATRIDDVVVEAEMATRHRDISIEAQALSDADTLFKALPVTPVMLAHRYLTENGISLRELASKIVGEQVGVHDAGFYFYSQAAADAYSHWASANLALWQCIVEALEDPTVTQLLAAI
ncbi:MAG TPA: HD family phosphohydrolase [Pseudonocardiaceae bacterium]|nr:HD family phosphohydrolase [Pseudonocardiaceae bacterium]